MLFTFSVIYSFITKDCHKMIEIIYDSPFYFSD